MNLQQTCHSSGDLQVIGMWCEKLRKINSVKNLSLGSVCKVRTKDPENFDEEVKSLVTAWRDIGII